MIQDKTILYIGFLLIIISILIPSSKSEKPKKDYEEDEYDEYDEEDYEEQEYEEVQDITESEVTKKTDDEETYVSELINELKNKSDKTQKDKDKIGLLEIKLKQLKNKR
jgi:hypothetical protein